MAVPFERYVSKMIFSWTSYQKLIMGFWGFPKRNYVYPSDHPDNSSMNKAVAKSSYINTSPGRTVEYHSKAPLRSGKIPVKTYGPDIKTIEYFMSKYVPDGCGKKDLCEDIVFKGGFSGSLPHFANFSRKDYKKTLKFKRTIGCIPRVINRFSSFFELNIPSPAAIFFTPIRPSASSGGESGVFHGSKKFGWLDCAVTALKLFSRVSKQPSPNWSVYTCGDREKRNDSKEAGDYLGSRIVMMQDFVEYLIAKPWAELVDRLVFNLSTTPIKLGRSNSHFGYHFNLNNAKLYPFSIELDWKKYDSTLSADKIVCAFGLVRGLFPKSTLVDNMFGYFCSGYLHKYVVQGDGRCYLVKSGTPSGSVWTSLINSFANCLLLEDILHHYRRFSEYEYQYDVSGDDGMIFLNKTPRHFDVDHFTDKVKRKLDMEITIRYFGAPINNDPDESIEFLKTCFYWDSSDYCVPTTPLHSILTRISCPAKKYRTYSGMINFLFSQTSTLINDSKTKSLISSFLAYYKCSCSPHYIRSYGSIKTTTSLMIDMHNDSTYFSLPNSSKMEFISSELGDRILPHLDPILYEKTVDSLFVENWLFDNTKAFRDTIPSLSSRSYYLRRVIGDLDYVIYFVNNLKIRGRAYYVAHGISRESVDAIKDIYDKHYDDLRLRQRLFFS